MSDEFHCRAIGEPTTDPCMKECEWRRDVASCYIPQWGVWRNNPHQDDEGGEA